jgi:hypothetical protein
VDWNYSAMVVYFYSGQWWIFTPALTAEVAVPSSLLQNILALLMICDEDPFRRRLKESTAK